ncbi:hypothetical protein Hanom_Chr10g00888861 [Helianthus anomalus]
MSEIRFLLKGMKMFVAAVCVCVCVQVFVLGFLGLFFLAGLRFDLTDLPLVAREWQSRRDIFLFSFSGLSEGVWLELRRFWSFWK